MKSFFTLLLFLFFQLLYSIQAIHEYPCENAWTYYKDILSYIGNNTMALSVKKLSELISRDTVIVEGFRERAREIIINRQVEALGMFYTGEKLSLNSSKELWSALRVWPKIYLRAEDGYSTDFNIRQTAYSDLLNLEPARESIMPKNAKYGNHTNKNCSNELKKKEDGFCIFNKEKTLLMPEYYGRVARILFYMKLRYKHFIKSFDEVVEGGKATLLNWNHLKPINFYQLYEFGDMCKYQHNRNPFLDFKELADYLYNDTYNGKTLTLLSPGENNTVISTPFTNFTVVVEGKLLNEEKRD